MLVLYFALLTAGTAKRIELDWIIKPKNQPMQDLKAAVGDTIVFTWRGRHNVFILPECNGNDEHKWDAFKCPSSNGNWGVELGESSPVEYTIPAKFNPGDYICFVCEISGHCSAGQHTTLLIEGGDPKPQPEPVSEIGIDWRIPRGKVDKDMQLVHASAGDTLTFTWQGFHNVWLMNDCSGEWDAFSCPKSDAEWKASGDNLGGDSPVSYTIPDSVKPGDSICFACEVGPHCSLGQYTTVVIKGDDGDDDTPFETLDNLRAFCQLADAEDCKKCQGKMKKGKCVVKAKKLKKIKCKKVKDMSFCKRLGCSIHKRKQTCSKKPKLA